MSGLRHNPAEALNPLEDLADFSLSGISEADLPPPDTKRWVMRRKAEVVAGVRSGLISLEEACQRYTLSVEEFLSWQRLIDRHGVRALRATRLQEYRNDSMRRPLTQDAAAD